MHTLLLNISGCVGMAGMPYPLSLSLTDGCVGMAGMPYPLSLSLTDGCVGMAGCHTLLC